jgi:hypothetical protein
MSPHAEVTRLLAESGAQLVRQGKHHIHRLPDGTNWVTPATPSDHRSWRNNLSGLRRKLGKQSKRAVATRTEQEERARANIKSDRRTWLEYISDAGIRPLDQRRAG